MELLLLNIKELVQAGENPPAYLAGKEMGSLRSIRNAFLLISDEMIVDYGSMEALNQSDLENYDLLMEIDCSGRCVFPSFCDPDSHLLYPFAYTSDFSGTATLKNNDSVNFSDSFVTLHDSSVDELYQQALDHLKAVVKKGTGAIEIKSGYGLEAEDEMKLLQVIRRLKCTTPLVIKSTFMGSPTCPEKFRGSASNYLDHILELLPAIAAEELADNLDLYYDKKFLSRSDSERLLLAGILLGLNVKIHSEELGLTNINEANFKIGLDILDNGRDITPENMQQLAGAGLFPVVMPGASFFHHRNISAARGMIDAGLPLAISTDFDPGSLPSCDMKFMQSLACLQHGLLPEEVINATTLNSAHVMGIGDGYGSITRGKAANVFVTRKIPSSQYLPYAFSSDVVEMVILDGEIL